MAIRRTQESDLSKKIKGEQQCDFLRVIPSREVVPIEDSFEEKRFIEGGTRDQYCLHLYGMAFTFDRIAEVSGEALDARIIEVYRLCYEAPNPKIKKEKVLAAFVRYHPGLIGQAVWFVKLVSECAQIKPSGDDNLRNTSFRAIANGFRGAAGPLPNNDPFLRRDLTWVPRMHLGNLSKQLDAWYKDKDLVVATPEGRLESAREKAAELVKEDPKLARYLDRIAKLLAERHLYEAALLIISVQSEIPMRDLQGERSR
jgi:hypothetical protein